MKEKSEYSDNIGAEIPFVGESSPIGEIRLLQAILLRAFLDLYRATHSALNPRDKSDAVRFLLDTEGKWADSRKRITSVVGIWSAEKIRQQAIKILGSDDVETAYRRSLSGFAGGELVLTRKKYKVSTFTGENRLSA